MSTYVHEIPMINYQNKDIICQRMYMVNIVNYNHSNSARIKSRTIIRQVKARTP